MKRWEFGLMIVLALGALCLGAGAAGPGKTDREAFSAAATYDQKSGELRVEITAQPHLAVSLTDREEPCDYVLILDQTQAVNLDLQGQETEKPARCMQAEIKQGASNFLRSLSERGHRVALVTWGDGTRLLRDWTEAEGAGTEALLQAIRSLPDRSEASGRDPSGALALARDLLAEGKERSQAVILIAAGMPERLGRFDPYSATESVRIAGILKARGVAVYTVGLYPGADPAAEWGGEDFFRSSDGSLSSCWQAETEEPGYPEDIPAANRFLNYLSGNFREAEEVGLRPCLHGTGESRGWEIIRSFPRTSEDFFFAPKEAGELGLVLEAVGTVTSTGGSVLQTDEKTVVQVMLSPWFRLRGDAGGIRLTLRDRSAGGAYGREYIPEGLKAEPEGKAIQVRGLDWAAARSSGQKLILRIPVEPEPGAPDALPDPVPILDPDCSGVYAEGGRAAKLPSPELSADKIPFFTVQHSAADLSQRWILTGSGVDLTELVPEGFLYGGYCLGGPGKPASSCGLDLNPGPGAVYYIIEVPEQFLSCRAASLEGGAWAFTAVDGGTYKSLGIDRVVLGRAGERRDTPEESPREPVACGILSFSGAEDFPGIPYTARSLLGVYGSLYAEPLASEPGTVWRLVPYWVTPDGVKVTGTGCWMGITSADGQEISCQELRKSTCTPAPEPSPPLKIQPVLAVFSDG